MFSEISGAGFDLKDSKIFQVSTHTHNAMPALAGYAKFKQIGHRDFVSIAPGKSYIFPELEGPGCITTIWMTFIGRYLELLMRRRVPAQKKLWLKIFFDDLPAPSVCSPVADFFGSGTTHYCHFTSLLAGMSSGGYYANFLMPFAKKARVEIENRGDKMVPLFFGAITYAKMMGNHTGLPVQELPEIPGYFYARYRAQEFRNSPDISGSKIPNQPYLILEENDAGQYLGLTLTLSPISQLSRFQPPYFLFPYLEGNLKVYVDDEEPVKEPFVEKPVGALRGPQSVEYTGVEDYFHSGWYYVKGAFAGPLFGCPVKSVLSGKVSQYRFHPLDGFRWKKKIIITLTHGEFDNVDCQMESVAYYYKQKIS